MIEFSEQSIDSFSDYVSHVEKHCEDKNILYRGQSCDKPLLPKIARLEKILRGPILDIEAKMVNDFKLETFPYLEFKLDSDWDWLALAQHHGMATRLLDWSTNPLVGLFFAIGEPISAEEQGVVWVFRAKESDYVKPENSISPFEGQKTEIFRPKQLSRRIVAQSGWFTAHKYLQELEEFIPLEANTLYKDSLTKLIISPARASEMRKALDRFGINHATLFPDLDGISRNIDRRYSYLSDEILRASTR